MEEENTGRAKWYIHGARTLRVNAKLSMTRLSAKANVARQSISNVEKYKPVTEITAEKIFGALNESNGNTLNRDDVIKSKSEK